MVGPRPRGTQIQTTDPCSYMIDSSCQRGCHLAPVTQRLPSASSSRLPCAALPSSRPFPAGSPPSTLDPPADTSPSSSQPRLLTQLPSPHTSCHPTAAAATQLRRLPPLPPAQPNRGHRHSPCSRSHPSPTPLAHFNRKVNGWSLTELQGCRTTATAVLPCCGTSSPTPSPPPARSYSLELPGEGLVVDEDPGVLRPPVEPPLQLGHAR